MNNTDLQYVFGQHNGKEVIFLHFPRSAVLDKWVRSLPSAKWSRTKKAWYIDNTPESRKNIVMDIPRSNSRNIQALQKYRDALTLKGYSKNTISTYTG